jgi:cell wall-associated NlpC family hydrolase
MIAILSALVSLLSFRAYSRASLELEVVALRQPSCGGNAQVGFGFSHDMHLRLQAPLASIAILALGLASSAAQQTTTTTSTTTTTTTTTTTAQPGKAKRAKTARKAGHCVTSLTKTVNPTTCYDTFTAAMAAVTGGKVTDAPADVRVAMKDQGLLARLNVSGDKKAKAPQASSH